MQSTRPRGSAERSSSALWGLCSARSCRPKREHAWLKDSGDLSSRHEHCVCLAYGTRGARIGGTASAMAPSQPEGHGTYKGREDPWSPLHPSPGVVNMSILFATRVLAPIYHLLGLTPRRGVTVPTSSLVLETLTTGRHGDAARAPFILSLSASNFK
jgi:hypothetical protein